MDGMPGHLFGYVYLASICANYELVYLSYIGDSVHKTQRKPVVTYRFWSNKDNKLFLRQSNRNLNRCATRTMHIFSYIWEVFTVHKARRKPVATYRRVLSNIDNKLFLRQSNQQELKPMFDCPMSPF